MKKSIALKMMMPLLLLFFLTLLVNITTTRDLQEMRSICVQFEEAADASPDVAVMAENASAQISARLASNGIISSVQLITVIAVIIIAFLCVVKPLREVKRQLDVLIGTIEKNEGDLSQRIHTKKEDEIGSLVQGINLFLDQLQAIMTQIKGHSGSLDLSSRNIMLKVSDFTKDTEAVSSDTTDMCTEIQALADNVSGIAYEMQQLVDKSNYMSEIAVKGKAYSTEMRGRANTIKDMAGSSKLESENITSALKQDMETSVKNSKSVNAIQNLTQEILSIAGQTNLLALNASIEAARAGDAGRGFAVVAEEIRQLADNSRNTASSIQQISNEVTSAVENLAATSDKLMRFVTTRVMEDYNQFVASAGEYLKDADNVENTMAAFDTKAKELVASMQQMNQVMGGISQNIGEEKERVEHFTETINGVTSSIAEIQDYTSANDVVSNKLKEEIMRFKTI